MEPAQNRLEQNPSRKRTQSELEQKLSAEKKSYFIEKKSFSSLVASNDFHKLAQETLLARYKGKLDGEAGDFGNASAIVFGFPMGSNKWRPTKPVAGTSGAATLSPSYHAERKALAKLINQCIENNEPGFSTLEPIQTHQKECSIRLISNEPESFLNAVEEVNEIIIANNNGVFTIFYKVKWIEKGNNFTCIDKDLVESLSNLTLTLPFEGNILSKKENRNIYELVYKEVESKRGYTHQVGEAELTIDVFLPFQSVLIEQKIRVIIYTERVPCNESSTYKDNTCDNFFKVFFKNISLRLIYSVDLSDGNTMRKNLIREYSDAREAYLFIRDRHVPKEKVKIDQQLLENIFTTIKKDEIFSYTDQNLNKEALLLFYSRICSYKTIFEDMIKLDSISEKYNVLSRFSLPRQSDRNAAISIVEQKSDDFSEQSLFFMRQIKDPQNQKKEINCKYQYEDNDIQAILSARLNELLIENSKLFIKPVKILAAVDNIAPLQLEARLKEEKEHNSGERVLLIPCNLKNMHWVGILVEIDKSGKVLRAEYIDSLIAVPNVPDKIFEQLKKTYPEADFKPRTLLKQSGYNSCGAYVIENLLMAAFGSSIRTSNEEEIIRDLHLTALMKYDKDFSEKFYERQKNNRPTTAVFHEDLGFTDTIKGIWFSKKELARILEIKKCLFHLPENLKVIVCRSTHCPA